MTILFNILLFLHVVVCLLLVLLVMMQRPKQDGLGAAFASGMMSESFGAQATDVLQKGTRFLAICFFVLSIGLAMIKAHQNRNFIVPIPAGPAPAETLPGGLDLENLPDFPGLGTPEMPAGLETAPATEDAPDAPATEGAATTEDAAPAVEAEAGAEPDVPAEGAAVETSEAGASVPESAETEGDAIPRSE